MYLWNNFDSQNKPEGRGKQNSEDGEREEVKATHETNKGGFQFQTQQDHDRWCEWADCSVNAAAVPPLYTHFCRQKAVVGWHILAWHTHIRGGFNILQ